MKDFLPEDAFAALKRTGNAFIAFNVNIDAVVHVDGKMERLIQKKPQAFLKEEIKRPDDLFAGILYSMKYGQAAELTMSKAAESWICKNIRADRKRMGGQVGIMSNLLVELGMQPIVYTPLLSIEQCRLFFGNVLLVEKGLKHPGEIKTNDKTKTNWIFEFDKGQRLFGTSAKESNRFIAASRPDKFRLKPFDLNFGFSCALLSGFQCIVPKYEDGHTYLDQFGIAREMIKKIRAKRKPLHIEMAFTENKKILSKIIDLCSMADSVGLDESELVLMLDCVKENALAGSIHRNHKMKDVLAGMEKLLDKIGMKKIHLHGRGYFLALAKDYHARPQDIKKSMEFASAVASAKALDRKATRKNIGAVSRLSVSMEGRAAEREILKILEKKGIRMKDGIAHNGRHYAVFVPTPLVKKVRDVVGLGDIISASIFTAETGFSMGKKESNL